MLIFKNQKKLLTVFYFQTNGQTKRQNSIIEVYLRAFINWEQNNWAKLLPIDKFAYNNIKNTSTGYTPFKFNYGYYLKVSFKEDVEPYLRSCSANKLVKELKKLIKICSQNLFHVSELKKKAHNTRVKNRSYTPSVKVWLNNMYIKTK